MYVCMCVCVCVLKLNKTLQTTVYARIKFVSSTLSSSLWQNEAKV